MKTKIQRGECTFRFGFQSPLDLKYWLKRNPDIRGFAFVGRSNVGKSSLINALFGLKTARTSKTPGRTREINVFSFKLSGSEIEQNEFWLFDLPGYGFAKISQQMADNWNQLLSTFFNTLPNTIRLVNLQDARHPNQASDLEFQDFIRDYSFNTILIFNKIDKLKSQSERAQLEQQKPALFKRLKKMTEIHFISAENKDGLESLEDSMVTWLLKKSLS